MNAGIPRAIQGQNSMGNARSCDSGDWIMRANEFLLSTTHSAETDAIAARETLKADKAHGVIGFPHGHAGRLGMIEAMDHALGVYASALADGVQKYPVGRSVKPVNRRYN